MLRLSNHVRAPLARCVTFDGASRQFRQLMGSEDLLSMRECRNPFNRLRSSHMLRSSIQGDHLYVAGSPQWASGCGYRSRRCPHCSRSVETRMVTGTDGAVKNWFRAKYQRTATTWGGKITWHGVPGQTCTWPTSCGTPSLALYRPNQDGGGPAQVAYVTDVNTGASSTSAYLSLYVNSGSAWASFEVGW
jgi:hypothetical protein